MKKFLKIATSAHIISNSLIIALVVGTVLNLINQGGVIFSGKTVDWLHLLLNYFVPYCVATYSATKNELTRK